MAAAKKKRRASKAYGFRVMLEALAILQSRRGTGVSFEEFRREQQTVRLRVVAGGAKSGKTKKARTKAGISRSTFERRMEALQQEIPPLRKRREGRIVRWDIGTERDTAFEHIPGYVVDYVKPLAGLARPGAINAREWQALRLATAKLNADNLSAFAAQLKSLESKLTFLLPPDIHRRVGPDLETLSVSEAFIGKPGPREVLHSGVLEELNGSILQNRIVQFDYLRRIKGDHKKWRVEPAGFAIGQRTYLLGFPADQKPALRRKDLHPYSFAVANMSNVEVTAEGFVPRKCDLLKHIESSFGAFFEREASKVTLRFSKSRERDVLTWHFHASQKVRVLRGGDIEVTLHCRGMEELLSHLFSQWREAVTIVKPASLKALYKKMIVDAARSIGWTPS